MNSRIASVLKRLIRGIKQHMDAFLLTIGGILIPVGFYLKIELPQTELGTVLVLVGLAAWLAAYYFVKDRMKKEQKERVEQRADLHKLFTDTHQLLSGIHQELQKLNQNRE